MTSRELYEAVLTELNKQNAPNLLLEDFNYFANKAVYQYINKRYNIYDINQQTTDDIKVLKSTATLTPVYTPYKFEIQGFDTTEFMSAVYTVELPNDYFHLLNCICIYKVNSTNKCYDEGTLWRAAATRLTADSWSSVMDNYWNRPTYKRPYYYIHNKNIESSEETAKVPTNPLHNYPNDNGIKNVGTDVVNTKKEDPNDIFRSINIQGYIEEDDKKVSQKYAQVRYGNASKVLLEIRYGEDNSVFELAKVLVDYIKAPQHIRLTQRQIDITLDTSQTLEFPDYVCQEIVNELVHIIMENIRDERIQTHPVVSQSIANPTQQQTEG